MASVMTVINGPNLARLGSREPGIYGNCTQEDLIGALKKRGDDLGLKVDFFQSDVEGEIVSAVNRAAETSAALVINPAGYSHYSVARTYVFYSENKKEVAFTLTEIREAYLKGW